jgi:hypothetical protein
VSIVPFRFVRLLADRMTRAQAVVVVWFDCDAWSSLGCECVPSVYMCNESVFV